jgi:hypothetical protein
VPSALSARNELSVQPLFTHSLSSPVENLSQSAAGAGRGRCVRGVIGLPLSDCICAEDDYTWTNVPYVELAVSDIMADSTLHGEMGGACGQARNYHHYTCDMPPAPTSPRSHLLLDTAASNDAVDVDVSLGASALCVAATESKACD